MDFLIGLFHPIAPSFTAAVTDLAFFVFLIVAIVLCLALGSTPGRMTRRIRCLMLFIGLISGCIAAVLAVPFDPVDGALYSSISTALGLVLTGYIASQVGPLAKEVIKPPPANTLDWMIVGYLAFWLIGAALSAILIVVNRTEWIAQAARCDPEFYARSVSKELRHRMPHDQKVCDRLNISGSATPSNLPLPVYKNLNIAPYSMAYIRALPWQALKPDQCVYQLKFTRTPGLWLECKTIDTDATSRSADSSTKN